MLAEVASECHSAVIIEKGGGRFGTAGDSPAGRARDAGCANPENAVEYRSCIAPWPASTIGAPLGSEPVPEHFAVVPRSIPCTGFTLVGKTHKLRRA